MIKKLYINFLEEEKENKLFLHLTANENIISKNSQYFLSSYIGQRYFMGAGKDRKVDLNPFTTIGLPAAAKIISEAEQVLKKMLNAEVININCLSGVHAMMATILSVTNPGDLVLSLSKKHGGHFATKNIIDRTGRKHAFIPYDLEKLEIDTKKLAKKLFFRKAKVLYLDSSYYITTHNIKAIRKAVGEKTIIIFDASHTIGLMMGGEFQQPLKEGADIICANTHKTLPGPHKGLIAFKDKTLGSQANDIIASSFLSSNQINLTLALANTILEMAMFAKKYAQQVIKNSVALGKELETLGYTIRKSRKGVISQNHQVHLLTNNLEHYKKLYDQLHKNYINVNFDDVFNDGIFVRIGTQEITRRGMKEKEMKVIAKFIDLSFKKKDIANKVTSFVKKYPNAEYCFDKEVSISDL